MAVQTILIDPVTRIEGHLKIDVKVDTVGGKQQVVDAFATGTLFRGFEDPSGQPPAGRRPAHHPEDLRRVPGPSWNGGGHGPGQGL